MTYDDIRRTRELLAERAKDYQDLAALAHIRMVRFYAMHSGLTSAVQDVSAAYSAQAQAYLTQLLELPQ